MTQQHCLVIDIDAEDMYICVYIYFFTCLNVMSVVNKGYVDLSYILYCDIFLLRRSRKRGLMQWILEEARNTRQVSIWTHVYLSCVQLGHSALQETDEKL